nr:hypothetical protein [Brevibacillus laterosporus]
MRDMSKKIVQLLEKELVVALGCTEPVAIAWAASVAKSYLEAAITSIDVTISANVMKNAMAVGIPGMQQTGIDFVSALGAFGRRS